MNYNIKEITELISERSKLVNKVHAASIKVSGLPHLSVSEAALIKRISTTSKYTKEDEKYIKELSTVARLLNIHMKWLKKEHIFFEWMVNNRNLILSLYTFFIKHSIIMIKITGNCCSRTQ